MKYVIVIAALTLAACWGVRWGQGQEADPPVRISAKPHSFPDWMDIKLEESQNIFAALTEADYAAVVKSADGLKMLSKLEGFVRRGTPGYRTQLRSFEFAIDEIRKQAVSQNLEGVALGFHQMTLSCVNCHKQLRNLPDDANKPRPTGPGS